MPRGRDGDRWGPVWVKCFGRYWHLQDVPASVWIEAMSAPELAGVFPGLVRDEDAGALFGLWATEPDMRTRCTLVAQRALGRASGREWHWSANLITEIQQSWTHLNGLLVREGVRSSSTSLSDYLDAAYTLLLGKLDAEKTKALDTRLRRLPSGLIIKPKMSSRADLVAFARD